MSGPERILRPDAVTLRPEKDISSLEVLLYQTRHADFQADLQVKHFSQNKTHPNDILGMSRRGWKAKRS